MPGALERDERAWSSDMRPDRAFRTVLYCVSLTTPTEGPNADPRGCGEAHQTMTHPTLLANGAGAASRTVLGHVDVRCL